MSKDEREVVYKSSLANADIVYKHGELSWCVYDAKNDDWNFRIMFETATKVIKPPPVLKRFAEERLAFLPSEPMEYGSTEDLAKEIYEHLYKYADYPDKYRRLDVWYCFETWIYDRFPVVSYRRALGDYGTGKTRWALTLGSICYKSFIQGAATTPAALFRLSDMIRGTQIIDENNFNLKTDVGQAIILILNSGYSRQTGVIVRCEGDAKIPKPFVTYSPKIIASRKTFPDEATESRTISHYSYETNRNDIPELLTDEFYEDALRLRNKLLLWRFRHLNQDVKLDEEFRKLRISGRLKEILLPLVSTTKDASVKDWLKDLAHDMNKEMLSVRASTIEATILQAIFEIIEENKHLKNLEKTQCQLTIKNIAEKVVKLEPDYKFIISARRVGSYLRKTFGFYVDRAPSKIIPSRPYILFLTPENIEKLIGYAHRYGIDEDLVTSVTKVMKVTLEQSSSKEKSYENYISTRRKDNLYSKVTFVTDVTNVTSRPTLREVYFKILKWLQKVCITNYRDIKHHAEYLGYPMSDELAQRILEECLKRGLLIKKPDGLYHPTEKLEKIKILF